MIRVELPAHLRTLARVGAEVSIDVAGPITQRSVLDALEAAYPVLRGTIRDHGTLKRRAFLRFFACEQDFSLDPPDTVLPDAVADGREPFLIVGALAGGEPRRGRDALSRGRAVRTRRRDRRGRAVGAGGVRAAAVSAGGDVAAARRGRRRRRVDRQRLGLDRRADRIRDRCRLGPSSMMPIAAGTRAYLSTPASRFPTLAPPDF